MHFCFKVIDKPITNYQYQKLYESSYVFVDVYGQKLFKGLQVIPQCIQSFQSWKPIVYKCYYYGVVCLKSQVSKGLSMCIINNYLKCFQNCGFL